MTVTATPTLTRTRRVTSTLRPRVTSTPRTRVQYELLTRSLANDPSQTRFSGLIVDRNGNPVDGIHVRATCYDFMTISYPSGTDGQTGWYDIFIDHRPKPCSWQLTIVETADRQTVQAELSQPITIEVTDDASLVRVDWRKNW